ncbi:MAG: aromatic ring-hydroxylating dioxygenase subunit alpha [Polyangiaceae bacterium]|nr:aromatic ring-hydroxylating dioxygenase subunit alpha [Polyangiaceae bacterium]
MIPSQWYPILFSRDLGRRPLGVRRGNLDLVLFRDDSGTARGLFDRCPHRGVPLSLGRVERGKLVCRYHGFEFDGGGKCVHMPCEGRGRPIPRGMCASAFPLREEDGILWLFWGRDEDALSVPIPAVDELRTFGGYTCQGSFHWPLNYALSIESNFDIHHFNFVHKSHVPFLKIGNRVDDIHVTERADGLSLRSNMVPEPGETGKAITFRVEFRAPGMSVVSLFDDERVVVYDCPIDADHTWRMVRVHQRAVKGTLLGPLWARVMYTGGVTIGQYIEDKPLAAMIKPRLPGPALDRPVRADLGITTWRKLRAHLIRQADFSKMPAHVRDSRWERAPLPEATAAAEAVV